MIRRLALLAALAAGSASAQDYAVVGRAVDAETGAAVARASVGVWRVSARAGVEPYLETGAVSELDGGFRVEGLSRGRYYVVVSSLGYVTARVDSLRLRPSAPVADLGTVRLAPDARALGDVEVTAERDRVEVLVDRTVYRIADDPIVSGGSVSEALETLPSVEVDVDGNVALRGVSNVAVLIDGRPAPVGRDFVGVYLQTLPADLVERVEVIPNPSAAYEPDGSGGILNIVLKDQTDLGLGGALTLGGTSQAGGTATGLVTWGRGPLRLSATGGLRTSPRDSEGDRFRINRFLDTLPGADRDVFTLNQSFDDARRRSSALAGLTADLALSPQTTLTLSTQGTLRDSREDDATATLALDPDDLLTADYARETVGEGGGWSGDLRLGLRHDIEGQSQEEAAPERRGRGRGGRGRGRRGGGSSVALGAHGLAVDLRLNASGSDDTEDVLETGLPEPGTLLRTEQTARDDRRRQAVVQADYARPLGPARLELGVRSEWQDRESDRLVDTLAAGAFARDLGRSTAYTYDDRVHAAYVQAAHELGALTVQLGVRGEVSQRTFTVDGETYDADDVGLYPSASALLRLDDATALRAGYSRRVDRPRGRQLNPFPSTDDPRNVRVGNPDLRPEFTHAVEVGVVRQAPWGSVTVAPFLRHTVDVVRRFQTVDAAGVTTSTYRNLDTQTSSGLEAVVSYQTGGALRGFLSVEGYRLQTDGTSVESGLGTDAFGWGGRLNATYSAGDRFGWGDLDLQTTARYRAPQRNEQGRVGARVGVDLALRQRLLDGRASLALRARDPLGLSGFAFVQDDARLYQEFSRSSGRREVSLTLTMTFGDRDRDRPDRPGGGAPDADEGGLDY